MGFMDNPLYAGLVAGLEKKYRQREERVRALLASGDREALTHRAEDVRQRLCRSLTDADLLRTLGDARALPAGSLCLDGYAVENILLVFRHGYCVPVNVYVPRCGAGKHPALVVSIGHWSDGKTIRENQIFCANLARNGILAAAYDPLFQGERCPYDREALAELFGSLPEDMLSVSMHMQAGNLAYLLGRNVAALFAHDSVAVLDYLCTRPDVDTGRIGCTGQSGGGTQSLYSTTSREMRMLSPASRASLDFIWRALIFHSSSAAHRTQRSSVILIRRNTGRFLLPRRISVSGLSHANFLAHWSWGGNWLGAVSAPQSAIPTPRQSRPSRRWRRDTAA